MKVVLVCNSFPPEVDGVGDYTWQLGKAFADMGIIVHIVCREQSTVDVPEGVSVHPVVKNWGSKGARTLIELAKVLQPDWVGVQYVPYSFHRRGLPFFLPRVVRAMRHFVPAVWITFHEVHIRRQGWRGWILGGLQRQIARRLCREAQSCVTSLEFYRDMLVTFHAEIHVIPIGSNVPVLPLAEEERVAFRQQRFPGQSFLVSTFGLRNQASLLESIARLNAEGADIGLVICGKTLEVNSGVKPFGVYYSGYLPSSAIGKWLQCTDLFVLPDFVNESGQGGTCLKSGSLAAGYAAGLPIIGIRGDMTDRALEHKSNIWLADSGQVADLKRAIHTLWHDRQLRQQLQTNGREFSRRHLDWSIVAARYMDFLKEIPHVESPD